MTTTGTARWCQSIRSGPMLRDLLSSPLGPHIGADHDALVESDRDGGDSGRSSNGPSPPALSLPPPPTLTKSASKPAGGSWLGLASIFKGTAESDEERLRKQVRDYEQRLSDMRELANRQAKDISSLRSMAEQQIAQASEAGSARDEERWRRMLHDASNTQEQALLHGQRALHELAASLQEAQKQAAQQQANEWRSALESSSEAHARVVEQLQAQLRVSSEEKSQLQTMLRDARRASSIAAAAAAAAAAQHKAKEAAAQAAGGGGAVGSEAIEKAVAAERDAAAERVRAAEEAADEERRTLRAAQAEAACAERELKELNAALRQQLGEASQRAAQAEAALRRAQSDADAAVRRAVDGERAQSERLLAAADEAVREAEEKLQHMALRRREACNRLQEACGAIRVLCRARPLSDKERSHGEVCPLIVTNLPPLGGFHSRFHSRFFAPFPAPFHSSARRHGRSCAGAHRDDAIVQPRADDGAAAARRRRPARRAELRRVLRRRMHAAAALRGGLARGRLGPLGPVRLRHGVRPDGRRQDVHDARRGGRARPRPPCHRRGTRHGCGQSHRPLPLVPPPSLGLVLRPRLCLARAVLSAAGPRAGTSTAAAAGDGDIAWDYR